MGPRWLSPRAATILGQAHHSTPALAALAISFTPTVRVFRHCGVASKVAIHPHALGMRRVGDMGCMDRRWSACKPQRYIQGDTI